MGTATEAAVLDADTGNVLLTRGMDETKQREERQRRRGGVGRRCYCPWGSQATQPVFGISRASCSSSDTRAARGTSKSQGHTSYRGREAARIR